MNFFSRFSQGWWAEFFKHDFYHPSPRETKKIEARFRKSNAEKRAAGCHCGKSATHVLRMFSVLGSVPCEFWTCEEHTNTNSWVSPDGGVTWIAGSETFEGLEQWLLPVLTAEEYDRRQK